MLLSRRALLTVATTSVAAAVAATRSRLIAAPVLPEIAPVPPAAETPICVRCSEAQAILQVVAEQLHQGMLNQFVLGRMARRNFEPLLSRSYDTVNFPRVLLDGRLANTEVVLDKHWEVTFKIPDMEAAVRIPDLLKVYLQAASIAIAEILDQQLCTAKNGRKCNCSPLWHRAAIGGAYRKTVLVTRRLPRIIPGLGALSHYVETDGIGTRTVMSYHPNELCQQFTFDILAGVGVLA